MVVHQRRRWKFVVFSILLGALVFLVLATYQTRRFLRESTTYKQLRMISLALGNYRTADGCYPPQYLVDKEGKPAHSWRVLILPYIGKEELFGRYSFDEPWNGPHNRLLEKEMPEVYRSPYADSNSTITQYVGIAGREAPWRGNVSLQQADLKRPAYAIIWIVEAANSDIHWMEPRDIPLEQASAGITAAGGRGIQSNYASELPAAWMDMHVGSVPTDVSPKGFRAMLTITGVVDDQGLTTDGKNSDTNQNGGSKKE